MPCGSSVRICLCRSGETMAMVNKKELNGETVEHRKREGMRGEWQRGVDVTSIGSFCAKKNKCCKGMQ